MRVQALLPKDKHDDTTITALLALSDAEIEPILPELLTWLQDMNWPIAGRMAEVIGRHMEIAEPCILEVLKGTDEVWKYNILSEMNEVWTVSPVGELREAMERITRHPTDEEIADEVDQMARQVLYRQA